MVISEITYASICYRNVGANQGESGRRNRGFKTGISRPPFRKVAEKDGAPHHPAICFTASRNPDVALEVVFQAKLHSAGAMRVHRMQERAAHKATRVASGIIRATVAGNGVAAGVAFVRIVNAELGVVENVERFRTKLKIAALGDFEMLQQSHIEVQTVGIVQEIASGVSKGKTHGSTERRRIAQDRADTLWLFPPNGAAL